MLTFYSFLSLCLLAILCYCLCEYCVFVDKLLQSNYRCLGGTTLSSLSRQFPIGDHTFIDTSVLVFCTKYNSIKYTVQTSIRSFFCNVNPRFLSLSGSRVKKKMERRRKKMLLYSYTVRLYVCTLLENLDVRFLEDRRGRQSLSSRLSI